MKENFEVLTNPFAYYETETFYLCRWIEDGKKYLSGYDPETKTPMKEKFLSVTRFAKEKGYSL